MTDLAAVTARVTSKPNSGAVKAGGAGAPAGSVGALDGAFSAILDAAAASKESIAAKLAGETVEGGAAKGAPGTPALLKLGAEPAPSGEASTGSGIQIVPNIKQADVAAAGTSASAGDVAAAQVALAASGAADDAQIDSAATGEAKPRKSTREGKTDPNDPALAQTGAQLVAATLGSGQQPQVIDSPVQTTRKGDLAIDIQPRGGTTSKATPVVPPDVKQAEQTQPVETPLASAAEAPAAAASAPAAPAPTLAKADAQAPSSTIAAQSGNAPAQTGDGNQAGANGSGEEKGSSRLSALRASAKADAEAGESAMAAASPFNDIIQSLPPVVQSQLGVQAPTSLPVNAAVAQTVSTSELLGNQVIDMGVSGQWIDRMAREIATLAEGTGHSRFQLMPPNLGRIQVDLWQGDEGTNVRLMTETDEAARRLREGQSALEANARLASLSLGSVSVEKSSTQLDQGREQGSNQNSRQQAETGSDAQQQASAQAQGQSGQGRGNTGPNRGGSAAVIGLERQAEPEQIARAQRAGDPRVRFA